MKFLKTIPTKLEAGALTYTLFVAILSSIILSAIILGGYYYKIEYLHYKIEKQNIENLSSSVALSLAVDDIPYHEEYYGQLFSEGTDSVMISRQPWGVWDVFKVRTFNAKSDYIRYFARAFKRSEKAMSALYLYDEGRPVSVSGKAKITGKAYLPKSGIRSSYVGRIGYGNSKLIYGTKLESKDEMPALNSGKKETIRHFTAGNVSKLYPEYLIVKDNSINYMRFDSDTVVYQNYRSVSIRDSISGRVWINASERIFVESKAFLENTILSAPIIEIDSGFTGALQLFATDTILIGRNVHLEYPSFLGVLNDDPPATISIEPNSKITGVVYMDGEKDRYNLRILSIADQATVEGMVYCNGMTDILGSIEGHISTRKFLINTFSGVYENYIFNAKLNGEAINPDFAGIDLWYYDNEKVILKWLD